MDLSSSQWLITNLLVANLHYAAEVKWPNLDVERVCEMQDIFQLHVNEVC